MDYLIRGSHPLGQCQALAVEGGLLISHKTNQAQLGGRCVQASYKQETQEEGVPLLNHQLIDSSTPRGAGLVTSRLFAGGLATIA